MFPCQKLIISTSLPKISYKVKFTQKSIKISEILIHEFWVQSILYHIKIGYLHKEIILLQLIIIY
jgi:hypothetical protein